MKLTELEPRFVRYKPGVTVWAVPDPQTGQLIPLTFAEAQGVEFLCPLCFTKNSGPVGTHICDVTFADRNVPDALGSHNTEGKSVRWTVSGDSFQNLTTTPSILLEGGCGWHGFITNGEIS
jgi:hypothetical protein